MEDKSVDELTEYWLLSASEVDLCNAFGTLMLSAKKENRKKIINSFFMRKIDHFNSIEEIPEPILKAMAKVKDEETAKSFNKDLMGIVNVWDNIRKEIACRKAYSVLRDGLKIRANANQILSSFYAVSREKPKNLSEFDLYTTEGSEIIGHDMKYGGVPGKAIKRSNILAKEIDMVYAKSSTKKFPDFSFEDEKSGLSFKVLHPRDKENLIWGYKTKCCFIPGGVADNYGNRGKSFVEYCATTGYAGTVEIGRENGNETGGFDVYEAFPVLVNGNVLCFHPGETANKRNVNRLKACSVLKNKAAVKAIEKSKGAIKAVVLPIAHSSLLNLENTFVADKDYFEPYVEGEYSRFEDMHTNLDYCNAIIAAEVNGEVLSGKRLEKYCWDVCHGDMKEIAEKLGLQFGEAKENFVFDRRENDCKSIEIPHFDLVKSFKNRYSLVESKIAELNKRMIDLDGQRMDINDRLREEVVKRNVDLQMNPNSKNVRRDIYIEKLKKNIDAIDRRKREVRREIDAKKERALNLYSGKDPRIIAEYYDISRDEIESAIYKKANLEVDENYRKDIGETGKQEKLRKRLIGTISKCRRPEFEDIKQTLIDGYLDDLSEDDIKELDESGILKAAEIGSEEIQNSLSHSTDLSTYKSDKVRNLSENEYFQNTVIMGLIASKFDDETRNREKNNYLHDATKQDVKSKLRKRLLAESNAEVSNEELSKYITDRIHSVDSLIDRFLSGEEISEKDKSTIEKLDKLYGINIEKIYGKFLKSPNLEDRVNKRIYNKIRANVPVGISNMDRIKTIKGFIDNNIKKHKFSEEEEESDIFHISYGRNWLIALGEDECIIKDKSSSDVDKKLCLDEILRLSKKYEGSDIGNALKDNYEARKILLSGREI